MPTTYRELIRVLEQDGWRMVSQKGSHQQFKHPTKRGRVTVAGKPRDAVPAGTLRNILRQAALHREDLP